MTMDEVLQLTRARLQKDLHPVQEIILRQVWEGKTYTSIAYKIGRAVQQECRDLHSVPTRRSSDLEVLQLTRARLQKDLHPGQEIILRQVWEGKTYTSIAYTSNYGEHYLRNIASGLWQTLSQIMQKPISKIG